MAKRSGGTHSASSGTSSASRTSSPKIPLSSISVNTTGYYSVLGHEPRGTGNYAFSIGSREAFDDIRKAFWARGSYTEALNKAKKEAQKRGESIIYVMS